MLQNLSSVAVLIGALKVKSFFGLEKCTFYKINLNIDSTKIETIAYSQLNRRHSEQVRKVIS